MSKDHEDIIIVCLTVMRRPKEHEDIIIVWDDLRNTQILQCYVQ